MLKKWFVINVLFFSLPNFGNHPQKRKFLTNMKMKELYKFLKYWLSTTTYHKKGYKMPSNYITYSKQVFMWLLNSNIRVKENLHFYHELETQLGCFKESYAFNPKLPNPPNRGVKL